jgi:hypothetical protein
MSCTSQGKLFLLPIKEDRASLSLSEGLEDQVADTPEERDLFMFGSGWGAVTDARVGPDGYLYVCAFGRNAIYRLRPVAETVSAATMEIIQGFASGGLPEVEDSDDEYLIMVPTFSVANGLLQTVIDFSATSPFSSLGNLKVRLEAATYLLDVEATISLYNFVEDRFDPIQTMQLSTKDSEYEIDVSTNPTVYIDPVTKSVRSRIAARYTGPLRSSRWFVRLDKIAWELTRQSP